VSALDSEPAPPAGDDGREVAERDGMWIAITEVTPELDALCRKAAAAVGGGFLSVDLLEHERGVLVNELNYTPEFHGFMDATGIDVANQVIDYVQEVGAKSAVA